MEAVFDGGFPVPGRIAAFARRLIALVIGRISLSFNFGNS
jgi:hypothetical protein